MPMKMDDEAVMEIRERLRDGKTSVTELMEEFGRSRVSILNAARGISFKHLDVLAPPLDEIEYRRKGQKITQSDHADILDRYDNGETMREIADSYEVDDAYICRIINKQRMLT